MSIQYYHRDGTPMIPHDGESHMELTLRWAKMFEDGKSRIVKQTKIGHYFVSTVFLGLNHQHDSLNERPLIFETMVFDHHDEKRADLYQDRYATEAEAKIGHRRSVWRYRLIYMQEKLYIREQVQQFTAFLHSLTHKE